MNRKVSPATEREYAELHAFLDYYATHVEGIDPTDPVHPTNCGREIVAEYGKSAALRGLRQAINETIEEATDLTPAQVKTLDAALRTVGIVTLTELRRRYSRQYQSILKRGRIRNETEYYLINGILAGDAGPITAEETKLLEALVVAFQPSVKRK